MKNLLPTILVVAILSTFSNQIFSQGCVAIRNMSCSSGMPGSGNQASLFNPGEWQVQLGYRHFKSFRHFRGDHEEANRVEEGTEVINHFNSFDFGLSYAVNGRLSLTATLPLVFNDRSSLYEHYGNSVESNPARARFHTQSSGIGDLRVGASYWLIDPMKYHKGNIALGLGIKAPTGDYGVTDEFHKLDDEGNDYTIVQPVDQSIQLGDGGWGINMELQGFHTLFKYTSMYFNAFYLSNPKNHNGVLRRANADPEDSFNYFSVPDQFGARLGFNVSPLPHFGISLGGRLEGIPAYDIIGEEDSYRRPGYVVSLEPGLTYLSGPFSLALNVPVAMYRNRIKSVSDITRDRHGDAAFADYLINVNVAYRFGGSHEEMPEVQDVFKDTGSGN
ncbi:MAG: transporter [Saprospiraceae bacterium]|nr:transporter [Saprospiraceae bacterium]